MRTPTTCDILVIDDDVAISTVLVELFEDEGYAVELACNGAEALHQLHTGVRPRLIVLDWMMPGMSGAQFRSAQQRDPALATIPVAVMSAHAASDLADVDGAAAILRKPFNLTHLVATVERLCAA